MTRGALPPSLTGAARAVVQPRDTDGGTLHWPHPRAHHLHRAVRPVVTRAHLFTCARPHPPAPLALRRFPPRWRGPFPFVKITLPQITTRPGLASFSLTVHSEPPSPFLMGRLVSPALLRPFLLLLAPPLRYPSGCAARLLRCYDCLPIGAHPDTRAPPPHRPCCILAVLWHPRYVVCERGTARWTTVVKSALVLLLAVTRAAGKHTTTLRKPRPRRLSAGRYYVGPDDGEGAESFESIPARPSQTALSRLAPRVLVLESCTLKHHGTGRA